MRCDPPSHTLRHLQTSTSTIFKQFNWEENRGDGGKERRGDIDQNFYKDSVRLPSPIGARLISAIACCRSDILSEDCQLGEEDEVVVL